MKLAIVGKDKADVLSLLEEHRGAFEVVTKNPDVVISYGGDGTLMMAEYEYPGIPKLYLKKSRLGKLSHNKDNRTLIQYLVRCKYSIGEHIKLQASAKGKTVLALNDIVIHNKDPRHAIRYTLNIDGAPMAGEVIGDGIVVASPLGSTGYYRSITDSYFELGIGLAFNNSTEQSDHAVLNDNRVITLAVTRGPAVCYADNQEQFIELEEGDSVRVKKSPEIARIIRI